MHIPIKVDYGVRALVDLAQRGDGEPIRAADIASRTAIPEPYLAQLLHTLSRNGIVKSLRGPQGGHVLAMDPSDVRLSTVMSCLGSPETIVGCLDDVSMCIHVPACAQREVWRSVEEAVHSILDSTTIADLVERTRAMRLEQRKQMPSRRLKPVAV